MVRLGAGGMTPKIQKSFLVSTTYGVGWPVKNLQGHHELGDALRVGGDKHSNACLLVA